MTTTHCASSTSIIAFAFVLTGSLAQGQAEDPVSLEEFCASYDNCRKDTHVLLKTEGGDIDTVIPIYWPAVYEDKISMLPGDELLVEAEIVGGKFTHLQLVESIKAPDSTFKLTFIQQDSGMLLTVHNPFDVAVKYHIEMIDFERKRHETSSCPILAGLSVYESWPYAIPELAIFDFRALEESDVAACEY